MTVATDTVYASKSNLRWAISDVLTIARRNILAIIRVPTALVFTILQPIMFVLLFRYVFGAGAISTNIPGGYVNYLLPGIIVQTTIFGAVGTAIGLAEDLQRGLIERFRALPMARMAVLAGRTVSDLGRNVLVLIIISLVGFAVRLLPLVGFRLRRAGRTELRGGAGDDLPADLSSHLRLGHLRPRLVDAGVAPRFRDVPTGQ